MTTIGRRSFPAAASSVQNTLSVHLQSSPSVSTFSAAAKAISVSAVISRRYITTLRYRGIRNGHVKKTLLA